MRFSIYHLGTFKRGQFDITSDCKSKSETGQVISIDDGDITTYIYEKPLYFKLDELKTFVTESFADGYGSYIAKYNEDEDGNIFVSFSGCSDGTLSDDMESICFQDEDGDKEYWEVFTGIEHELLVTSAYMSVDDVIINRPCLKPCND